MRQFFVLVAGFFTLVVLSGFGNAAVFGATIFTPTTTVEVLICGDAIIQTGEICDDGDANNDGAYATSTALRRCQANCLAYGPYCGDGSLQPFFGEECDDSNNTSGDRCDALCQNEDSPTSSIGGTGGGGGGGSSRRGLGGSEDGSIELDNDTEVNIVGLAYPGATVSILVDGTVEEVVEANNDGEFDHRFLGLTPGSTTFGFWAEDNADRRSITFSTTFEVIESAVTTLSGVYIPPTISVNPQQVALGEQLTFVGTAAPDMSVITTVDNGQQIATTTSASGGEWLVSITSSGLDNESFHGAKALYRDPTNSQIESGYSQTVNFYVGVQQVGDIITPDINRDGRVDLVDFSIFVFNWNTAAVIADFNQDGIVDLADFSIMLFAWTG